MATDKNLQFISSKIVDTEIALLHCHANSILRVPNTIIKTLKVDSHGNIWFFIARPQQLINQFDQDFPVSLTYFRKGNSYSMQIHGVATMLTHESEIAEDLKLSAEELSAAFCAQLLIRVKISRAEFHDLASIRHNFFQRIKAQFYHFLNWAQPMHRQFDFGADRQINYGLG